MTDHAAWIKLHGDLLVNLSHMTPDQKAPFAIQTYNLFATEHPDYADSCRRAIEIWQGFDNPDIPKMYGEA